MGFKEGKERAFTFFQKFGQTLLVPVAILPAVGLLYGIGMAMTSETLTGIAPWLTSGIWPTVAAMFSGIGSVIFGNLSLLFAVGVAVGLAKKNDGTAGLAAVAGYLIMNISISIILGLDADKVAADTTLYQSVLGINTLRTGVFGGIAVGLVAAWAYNRFHTIKPPECLFRSKTICSHHYVCDVYCLGGGIYSNLADNLQYHYSICGFCNYAEYKCRAVFLWNYCKGIEPVGTAQCILYTVYVSVWFLYYSRRRGCQWR